MTQVAKMFTHRVVYLTLCPLLAEALRPAGKRDEAADGSLRAPGCSLSKGTGSGFRQRGRQFL
jgi:hypothetical protein